MNIKDIKLKNDSIYKIFNYGEVLFAVEKYINNKFYYRIFRGLSMLEDGYCNSIQEFKGIISARITEGKV